MELEVSRDAGPSRSQDFLVDSGAVYSVLPNDTWRALGLGTKRRMKFTLADGTQISRAVSECRFTYRGVDAVSPVILGDGDDVALLGAVTLESLALVLNPFDRTLHPMHMSLASHLGA